MSENSGLGESEYVARVERLDRIAIDQLTAEELGAICVYRQIGDLPCTKGCMIETLAALQNREARCPVSLETAQQWLDERGF